MLSFEAPGGVGLVEEAADLVDERAVGAEVDGVLSAVFAPGESVVGSEAPPAVGAPGGDDGALVGEAFGVVGEEVEGIVAGRGDVHTYSISIWADNSIRKLNTWGVFWWGWGLLVPFSVAPRGDCRTVTGSGRESVNTEAQRTRRGLAQRRRDAGGG